MIPESAQHKSVSIISNDIVIFDALSDNITLPIELFNSTNIESITNAKKLDLLIIDQNIAEINIPFYCVDILVNLTSKNIFPNEIKLTKPLRLNELLSIISNNTQSKYLFCCINNKWIYHQRLAKISSLKEEIFLTDKENNLFLELLISKNFSSPKESLKRKIWSYHQDSESSTVETHLYKLKQKLPKELLKVKATQCYLDIDSVI